MVVKRRLLFWLIKAYIQKWGKAIIAFFLLGLVIFFFLQAFLVSFITKITSENKEVIGTVGTYTVDSLPISILQLVSQGLTNVDTNGVPQPGLATSWKVTNNGTTYTFTLKKGLTFSDGTPFTSKEIPVSFSNVQTSRPNDYTIVFHLKEPYAPFLVTLSRPIFRNGFVGIGDYKVKNVSLNTSFVQSLTLVNAKNSGIVRIYQFYPTEDALKLAFALGEISVGQNLSDISFEKTTLTSFPNAVITKKPSYDTLVTIFYNTADKVLSDSKMRNALSYAVPNTFDEGIRAYTSISPASWAYQNINPHTQDYTHAKLLVEASVGADEKNYPTLSISTLSKYEKVAEIIQNSWLKVGIHSKIEVVDTIPASFQVYIGDFHVPEDPDQYTLWHSHQDNNITNFNTDVRIDKLLEDGRKTVDQNERFKFYADFQKYLGNEQPATFLYFPFSYSIKRR